MVKKILFISLALFVLPFFGMTGRALADAAAELEQAKSYYETGDYPKAEQLYQSILKEYGGTDSAFTAQKKLTILYVSWGKKPQAEAAFQELANLSVSADIVAAIRDMASYYSGLQKSEEPDKRFQYYQALSICRRQLDVVDQPGNEYAMWLQVRLAMSNIELSDDAAVQAAVDKLLAEFSDNAQIARGVHEVALKYRVLKKYDRAITLYQYVVDHWPNAEYTAWSQLDLAKSYVALGDDPNAQAAVNKLLVNFSNNPSIAQIIYDIASCYRQAKKHPKAINLYQHIIDNWPQQKYAMWSLRDLAMSNFDRGDDPNAQAAVDKLIARYYSHTDIPWNLYEIAKYYRERAKYKEAIKLYKYIVDSWPGADHAIWSQLDLAMSYDTIGDDPNAEAAVYKLVTRFSKNQHIAGVVYEVAKSYRRAEKHEKANQICHLIIDKWAQSEHALWAQRDLAIFNISFGDLPNAQAAVDKLLADFSSQGRIGQAVYDIAKQYHALQKYGEAGLLYQHVIDTWPDDEYAMWAQADLAKLYIDIGNDAAAQAALDSLIADFNDHPDLPRTIVHIEEQYYFEVVAAEPPPRENYLKPVKIWEKVMKKLPDFFYDDPDLYYFIADCYRHLGEYEKAIQCCRIVADKWTQNGYAVVPRTVVPLPSESSADYEAVHNLIDRLIIDFNDHPGLAATILRTGHEYRRRANDARRQGLTSEAAADNFNAIVLYDRVMKEFPSSPFTATAYFFSALSYRDLGEWQSALDCCKHLLDNWPGYKYAQWARRVAQDCSERLTAQVE